MRGNVIQFPALQRFTAETFRRAGLSDTDAMTGAELLARTDAIASSEEAAQFVEVALPEFTR